MHNRSFQGNVNLVHLGGALILSDFEMISNEEIVKKMFMGKLLFLERWSPSVGRLRNGVCLSEIWVRIMCLPVHLWDRELFINLGNTCNGFMVVDEDTTYSQNLQWAKVLVKAKDRILSSLLNVVVYSSCFAIRLWWKSPSSMEQVAPRIISKELGGQENITLLSCTEGCVGN